MALGKLVSLVSREDVLMIIKTIVVMVFFYGKDRQSAVSPGRQAT